VYIKLLRRMDMSNITLCKISLDEVKKLMDRMNNGESFTIHVRFVGGEELILLDNMMDVDFRLSELMNAEYYLEME
jgi:hypothetical protein